MNAIPTRALVCVRPLVPCTKQLTKQLSPKITDYSPMPRRRRVYFEHTNYELIPRTKDTLPLPPTKTTNEILLGIKGRTQRDDKVTLSNFVHMNNHEHILAVSQSANELSRFHMELQKKTTDAVKALTGKKQLNLWENRPPVVKIATLEDAILRLIYIFSNPSKAGLSDSIDNYPGLSTWEAFTTCPPAPDAATTITTRWHPTRSLPELPTSLTLTPQEDTKLANQLKESPEAHTHALTIYPFAWLIPHNITDLQEIEAIRQRIIKAVRLNERRYALEREKKKQKARGATFLLRMRYMKPHKPKKSNRRIFLICHSKRLRRSLIRTFKEISNQCTKCFQLFKRGLPTEWPPGTFIPWLPPSRAHPPICGSHT